MADIVLEDLTKVFRDGTVAVDAADVTVPDGSLFVFVGPSGCGKTTLLRLVAGLEQPTEGRVLIGSEDVTELSPRNRDVAMIFQSYALYPHLTAYENIAFGLRSRRVDKAEVDLRVRRVASLLGLGSVLEKRPRRMSGGQRQRVALGRAIVREPQVFLMDEPLSDLDANMRDQMRGEVSRLQRTLGVTTLYVTHDQGEALMLGDQVAVMDEGRVRQVGTPKEVYDRPEDLFVAAFLGTPPMNLAEATVQRDGPGTSVQLGSHRLHLDRAADGLAGGRQVVFGMRPEHLRLARPEDDRRNVIRVPVDRREQVGSEAYLRFTVDAPLLMERDPREAGLVTEEDPWAAERPNTFIARIDSEADVVEGGIVGVFVDPGHVQLFDPATELAIR
jgi:multiple sugar transport system ATP-binding protein